MKQQAQGCFTTACNKRVLSNNSVDDGDVLSAVCGWMPPDFAITHDWRRGCQTSNVREIPIIPTAIKELFKVVVGSLAEVERVQLSSSCITSFRKPGIGSSAMV
ncbi:hypothetical protein [Metapseudomonas otitidis]|uniref:hypothetical protein n=1 Tax=Metapseudomonas otitidis TaxID=319939 RepID=UPI001F3D21B1|nr:hypothetical protein [Pseudomonas otitidis]